ncbi:MAG TPA: hypothetical protein DDW27_16910 [Bacteroidales bacterium]|nr:hypothetical protein [Bacteroidales bacterium]
MESPDQYNFSIFRPRNLHGRKNRNVIFTMLVIWAIAVFGFQFLLKSIQKPTPEKTLMTFESIWPKVIANDLSPADYKSLLNSLVLVKGKNMVKPKDQELLSDAISCAAFSSMPDTLRRSLLDGVAEIRSLKTQLLSARGDTYLEIAETIKGIYRYITQVTEPWSGFREGSLEAPVFTASLNDSYPASLNDVSFTVLPEVMKFYLTHNQSVLTDTKFLGFPFHYFYTAVFLLVLFIVLCIIYNVLVERRLRREGVVE